MHEPGTGIWREVPDRKDVSGGATSESCLIKGGVVGLLGLAEVGDEVAWSTGYDVVSVYHVSDSLY